MLQIIKNLGVIISYIKYKYYPDMYSEVILMDDFPGLALKDLPHILLFKG